ncbi:hypothetical protein I4U23_023598 [Adineta vaga]|nr:hypothetical protein I4U23_023598 [Adineta vaga]
MASTVTPVLPPAPEEVQHVEPNHFIIWLDKHIGQPNECVMLKHSFILAMNPTNGLYEQTLEIDDTDRSLATNTAILVRIDNVEFMFQIFDNVEKCFEVIEKNLHKRIFLITSGSKGKILIPSLKINFPEMFGEDNSMYVFCSNMNMVQVNDVRPTNAWAMHFLDDILMYNHQNELLPRMVYDAASYFSGKANDLAKDGKFESALQYLLWAKQMYRRYTLITKINTTPELESVDQRDQNIKHLRSQQTDNDKESYGEPCQ